MNKDKVSSVWNFEQKTLSETNYITHDYLRWYGKLVPQLVQRLLKLYTEQGDKVLANFAGSGTVLVESSIRGRDVVGTDTNPLSRLLCRVKVNPYNEDDEFIERCEKAIESRETNFSRDQEDKKWFFEDSYQDIRTIREEIRDIQQKEKRDFYKLALASVIKKGTKVDSRCVHHIVVDEEKEEGDILREFTKKVEEMKESAEKLESISSNTGSVEVWDDDATELNRVDDSSVDFIISHPPYLGAVNYSSMYKLENKILGYEYDDIRSADVSTTSVNKYMEQMEKVFDTMNRVLKEDSKAAVVIGDTRKDGDIVPTSSFFIDYALDNGFRLKDIFIWVLNKKAGMNVKRHGNYIDHNYILILEKDS